MWGNKQTKENIAVREPKATPLLSCGSRLPIAGKMSTKEVEILPKKYPATSEELRKDVRDLELKETNLVRRRAFAAIADALEAKIIVRDRYGNLMGTDVDHKIRLQAAKDALEILGDNNDSLGSKIPLIKIGLSNGNTLEIGGK